MDKKEWKIGQRVMFYDGIYSTEMIQNGRKFLINEILLNENRYCFTGFGWVKY